MITIYLLGVAVMAIAILYFNYKMMPILSKKKEFWIAFILMCLTSWVGIILALITWIWNVKK